MRWTDLRLLSPLFLSLVIIGWEKLDYRCNYLCPQAQSMGLDQCIKLVRFRSKGESYIVMEINLILNCTQIYKGVSLPSKEN